MTLSLVGLALWGMLALVIANPALWTALPLSLGIIGFTLTLFVPSNRRAVLALVSIALLLGGVSLVVQTELNKPNWISNYVTDNPQALVELELLNRPRQISGSNFGTENLGVAVRLLSIDGTPSHGRGFLIYQEHRLNRGEKILTNGTFHEPGFNPRDAFLFKQSGEIEILEEATGSIAILNELRANFVSNLRGITSDSKVLVSGLAIGEIGGLSEQLEEQMRITSLTHLVAVSGSNCAIVVGLVYLLAVRFRFGRYGRTAASLMALVGYVLLVGPDPSVLRAAVMSACVIAVLALGRRSWAINSLALAAITLLIADPWLAVEFGFGLSVLATAGILLLAPVIANRLGESMPKPLALGLAVTLSAQLTCLPLLMQLQPGLPTYSIIANLLAGPMVAPVTVLGIAGVLVTPILPGLVGIISQIASFGTFWIESVASFFAGLPMTYFPFVTGSLAAVIGVLLILSVSLWLKSPQLQLSKIGLSVVVIISVATLTVPAAADVLPGGWPGSNWSLVACDVGQGDALVLRSRGVVALVDVGAEGKAINQCLADLGLERLDLLVLTHFDFDHVGGLEGALKGRSVATAIISGFPDDRPATKASLALLEDAGAQVLTADPSLAGTLGEFKWRVLSPTREALEAKDSNDASVVLLLESTNVNLLLLGDLGEAGQERLIPKIGNQLSESPKPLILKVSHHGSNDQSSQFHLEIDPDISIISVGRENGYGHPGSNLISLLKSTGSQILRTDEMGSIAFSVRENQISFIARGS